MKLEEFAPPRLDPSAVALNNRLFGSAKSIQFDFQGRKSLLRLRPIERFESNACVSARWFEIEVGSHQFFVEFPSALQVPECTNLLAGVDPNLLADEILLAVVDVAYAPIFKALESLRMGEMYLQRTFGGTLEESTWSVKFEIVDMESNRPLHAGAIHGDQAAIGSLIEHLATVCTKVAREPSQLTIPCRIILGDMNLTSLELVGLAAGDLVFIDAALGNGASTDGLECIVQTECDDRFSSSIMANQITPLRPLAASTQFPGNGLECALAIGTANIAVGQFREASASPIEWKPFAGNRAMLLSVGKPVATGVLATHGSRSMLVIQENLLSHQHQQSICCGAQ